MDQSVATIRLEIDGRWSANQMAKSLQHIEELYNLRLMLEIMKDDLRNWDESYIEAIHFPPFRHRISRLMRRDEFTGSGFSPFKDVCSGSMLDFTSMSKLILPEEQLAIMKIKYGSPGFEDLAGIGKIIEQLLNFLRWVIEYFGSGEVRKLDNETKRLSNEGMRIWNARQYVQLAKEWYGESEFRSIVSSVDERQSTLIDLIKDGKILSAKVLHGKQQTSDKEEKGQ